MTLALTVILWALAVAVAFLVATVIVGAVIGLVKLARGHRAVAEQEKTTWPLPPPLRRVDR